MLRAQRRAEEAQLDNLGTPTTIGFLLLQSRYTYVHVGNYQSFGKAKTQRGIVGNDSIRNPIRFQGQYEDED